MKSLLSVLIGISCISFGYAQNSNLWTLNGKQIPIRSYQLKIHRNTDTLIYFTKLNGNLKKKRIEDLFSVIDSTGSETVFYRENLEGGDFFSEDEMRSFLRGENQMNETYHAPMITIYGVVAGLAGTLVPSAQFHSNKQNYSIPYGLLIPASYIVFAGNTNIPSEELAGQYPQYKNNEYYLMGCQEAIRKKRMRNSLIGVGIGILGGSVILLATH